MARVKLLIAGCGHALTRGNLGGRCGACGRLCCRDCLTVVEGTPLCPRCLKEYLKGGTDGRALP